MKFILKQFSLLGILACMTSLAFASSSTHEMEALSELGNIISIISIQNDERLPLGWSEISKSPDIARVNKVLARGFSSAYPIEQHYEFVSEPISIEGIGWYSDPALVGSRVVLMRKSPLANDSDDALEKQFRHLIIKTKSGRIERLKVPETLILEMLEKFGLRNDSRFTSSPVELEQSLSKAVFFHLHPELDPLQKVPTPSHEGAAPVVPHNENLQPSSSVQEGNVIEKAAQKEISWWAIGGAFAFVIAAATWLIRFTKKSRK